MGTLLGRGWTEERWLSGREAVTTRWRTLGGDETHTLPRGARVWLYDRRLGDEHRARLVELDGPGVLRGPLAWGSTEESARLRLGRAMGPSLLCLPILLAVAALLVGIHLNLENTGADGLGEANTLLSVACLAMGVFIGGRVLLRWGGNVVRRRRAGGPRARDGWRGWLAPPPEDLTRSIPAGDPPDSLIEPERDDRPPLVRHADHLLQGLRARASELPEPERADLMAPIERIEATMERQTALTLEDSRERGEVRDLKTSLAALEAQIGIRGPGPAS